MNKNILNTGVQDFILDNLDTDIMSVIFKKSIFPNVSSKELAEQIEAKKRCRKKLPSWFNTPNIYYPRKLNIEQCSSEICAAYKAGIVQGNSLVDLTGGLGVDSFFFRKEIDHVIHCEIDGNLSQIATHNFEVLGAKDIQTNQADGMEFLAKGKRVYDWAYLDPSRRNDKKGKVFLLSDCLPNPLQNLELLLESAKNVLVKTSPLLDLSLGIDQFKYVKEIHIVAIKNEVKELLWVLNKKTGSDITVHTANILSEHTQTFSFNWSERERALPKFGLPLEYLYEPNAAILKSGAFKLVSEKFDLLKIHPHTHLYTAAHTMDFPGRIFRIEKAMGYNKKSLKSQNITKANIATRNFTESVASLRKHLKIKEGGDIFLFFIKNIMGEKVVLQCSKTIPEPS